MSAVFGRWTADEFDAAQLAIENLDRPKLEVGSGYAPEPGFVHVDLNENAPDLDWCGPVDDLPWHDGTFVELRAVDILEHLSYRDTDRLLAEWARVLCPGGRMFIQTPDAETMIHWYLSGPARLRDTTPSDLVDRPSIDWLAWRLLGGHADDIRVKDDGDWRWNAHFALFSQASLVWHLERAGMQIGTMVRNPFPNLQVWAVKP